MAEFLVRVFTLSLPKGSPNKNNAILSLFFVAFASFHGRRSIVGGCSNPDFQNFLN